METFKITATELGEFSSVEDDLQYAILNDDKEVTMSSVFCKWLEEVTKNMKSVEFKGFAVSFAKFIYPLPCSS